MMFPGGEDLPLFSGATLTAQVPSFNPPPATTQTTWAQCRICLDTGSVDGKRCWCQSIRPTPARGT